MPLSSQNNTISSPSCRSVAAWPRTSRVACSGAPGGSIQLPSIKTTRAGEGSTARVVLMEGNWIDPPGAPEQATLDVRGHAATLLHEGDEIVLFWEESGIRYALRAYGVEKTDVVAV